MAAIAVYADWDGLPAPDADLRELWSRIVFNVLVSNTDDHLRNHGFILVPGKGWRWPKIAARLGIPAREQHRMASAFGLAG